MTTENPATLIPVKEAAALAGVTPRHVYRLIERGDVAAVRVGTESGPLRIPREPFLAWLFGEEGEAA